MQQQPQGDQGTITTKFSTRLKAVLGAAEESAKSFHHGVVDTDHLLLSLRTYQGSVAAEVLKSAKVQAEPLRAQVLGNHPLRTSGRGKPLAYTGQAKRAIVRATWTAGQHGHHFVGTEHLLAALIAQRDGKARTTLLALKVDMNAVRHQLKLVLRGTTHFPDITETLKLRVAPSAEKGKTKTPLLDEYCIDLNVRADAHRVDPVIGREDELARVIDVLERRTKNNVVLVGEPGVGKTAIVEGLAHEIVHGRDLPQVLVDKRVVQLDLTALLAGTSYRGDFEDRLQRLLVEIEEAGNIILFIDEVHTLVGTGNVGGSLDAAGMLKSALAQGAVRVIGATTTIEYKTHIEKDAALERRFQVVQVAEVSPKRAEDILFELRPVYEEFHGVKVSDEAVYSAVELAVRYIPERFLPDKAIDVLDEAMSMRKVASLRERVDGDSTRMRERVSSLAHEAEQLVDEERYAEALNAKQRAARLKLRLSGGQKADKKRPAPDVTDVDVARVVARISQVPLEQVLHSDAERFVSLARSLKKKIVGQDHAVEAVAQTLLRTRAGLHDPARPLGTFLFIGPSGVGKTELARQLAEHVYQRKDALIRLDMSEFGEKHTVARLIGAPPGYVGYGEGGKLTEAVRRRPYSVVLFDEIEKAHPDVAQILLQVFEDGRLTDAAGKVVSFRNTVLILTSNLGNRYVGRGDVVGFGQLEGAAKQTSHERDLKRALQDHFKPELLGRIDKVVAFRSLGTAELTSIVALEFGKLAARAEQQGVKLRLTDELIAAALKRRNPDSGARFVRQFLQDEVEPKLAELLVKQRSVKRVTVGWQGKHVALAA